MNGNMNSWLIGQFSRSTKRKEVSLFHNIPESQRPPFSPGTKNLFDLCYLGSSVGLDFGGTLFVNYTRKDKSNE